MGGKWLLAGVAMALASCAAGDWRSQAIAQAEDQIRSDADDPAVVFSRVQVTGDDKTGQTCGYVTKKVAPDGNTITERFIVYIDQTAGPYVEGSLGKHPMPQGDFESAWRNDCVNEGYNS
jgi:hypothetical protein